MNVYVLKNSIGDIIGVYIGDYDDFLLFIQKHDKGHLVDIENSHSYTSGDIFPFG